MTEKCAYCSTVPRTFVHDCRLKSPPKIISSHSKVKRCVKMFSKKKGLSLFGT